MRNPSTGLTPPDQSKEPLLQSGTETQPPMYVEIDHTLEPIKSKESTTRQQILLKILQHHNQQAGYQELSEKMQQGADLEVIEELYCRLMETADNDTTPSSPSVLETDIPQDGQYFTGFYDYIRLCYANHWAPHIRPEDITFVFLSVVFNHMTAKSEDFSGLFTTKPKGKRKLIVSRSNRSDQVARIAEQIKNTAPGQFGKIWPVFSTDTQASRNARDSILVEAAERYYSYSVMHCGLPGILITGNTHDWAQLLKFINKFQKLLYKYDKNKSMNDYFDNKIKPIVVKIHDQVATGTPNPKWCKNIYEDHTCTSGSHEVVTGWITDLYWADVDAKGAVPLKDFMSHITSVTYTIAGTKKRETTHYALCSGTLFTMPRGDKTVTALKPDYHYVTTKAAEVNNTDDHTHEAAEGNNTDDHTHEAAEVNNTDDHTHPDNECCCNIL